MVFKNLSLVKSGRSTYPSYTSIKPAKFTERVRYLGTNSGVVPFHWLREW